MPPHAPRARPRFAAAAERMVSVSGITIAPPSPWNARARFSASTEGASAAAIEPSVKIPMPTAKTRRAEPIAERGSVRSSANVSV